MVKEPELNNTENLPWFRFSPSRFLNSEDVINMTDAEVGIWIKIMSAVCIHHSLPKDPWQLSKLLHSRYETTTRWLQNWSHLVVTLESDCTRIVVPKVEEIHEKMGKTSMSRADTRQDKTRQEQAASKPEPETGEKHLPVSRVGFDPFTFSRDITAASGNEYEGSEIRRILDFIFVHKVNPSSTAYWTDPSKGNITSVKRLAQAIDTMDGQVPPDWTPPQPKQKRTRMVCAADCPICRRTGQRKVPNPDTAVGGYIKVPCDCPKQEEEK